MDRMTDARGRAESSVKLALDCMAAATLAEGTDNAL
jgi:hypothetical protein